MTFISFIIVTLLAVLGVSALVEFYKKTIRGGKSKTWENRLVGAVLSIGFSALICFTGLAWLPLPNVYLDWAIYSVVIFLIQLFFDMKVIKKLIISALQSADIKKLFEAILPKLGLDAAKIRNFLTGIGINRDTLILKLVEAGVNKDKAEEIATYIFGVEKPVKATENPS